MKKTITIASLILSIGLVFTGCSNNDEKQSETTSSTQSSVEEDTAQVSETINNYYNTMIEESSNAMDVSGDVEKTIREVAGDDTYEAFSTTDNPFESFDELSDEQSKELADKLQELNPIASTFDYSKMEDKDRAVLNLLNIVSSIMFLSAQDQTIEISVPADAILIEDNSATVNYSDMIFKVGDKEQPMVDALGGTTLYLVKIDEQWKVDGQKTYETTRESALNSTDASDSGEG